MSELGSGADGREGVRRVPKIRGGVQPLPAELAPPPVAPLLATDDVSEVISALFEPEVPEVRSALFDAEDLEAHLFEPLLERPPEEPTWPEGIPVEALSALDDLLPEEPASPPVRIAPLILDLGADEDQAPPPLPGSPGSSLLAELDFDVDEDEDEGEDHAALAPEVLYGPEEANSSVAVLGAAVSLLPAVEPPASPESTREGSAAIDVHGWFAELPEEVESASAPVETASRPAGDGVEPPAPRRQRVIPALAAALLGGVLGFQAVRFLGWETESVAATGAAVPAPVAAPRYTGLFSEPTGAPAPDDEALRSARPTYRLVARGSAQHLSGSVSSREAAARARDAAVGARADSDPQSGGERRSDPPSEESPADEARALRLSDFVWEGGAPPTRVTPGRIRRISTPPSRAAVGPTTGTAGSAGALDPARPRGTTLSEELAAATASPAATLNDPATAAAPAAAPSDLVEQSALTPEEVSRVVVGLKSSWRQCAQAQALRHPGVHGTLHLRWDILPDGTTAAASVDSSRWSDSPLARCVLARLATAQFPASGQRISPVLLPLRF